MGQHRRPESKRYRDPKLRHRGQTRTGSILERDGMTMSGPPECEDLTSSCNCWNVVTGQLWRDLTRNAWGTLADETEEEVFEVIKRLAVREENTMVARVALHNMKQDRDEPIHAYGADSGNSGAKRGCASTRSLAQNVTRTYTTRRPY